MEINWQNVFYFTASLAMIVVFITSIWLLWLFFIASRLIKNLSSTAHAWRHVIDTMRYFRTGIMLKVLRFIVRTLDRGGEHEQQ